MIAAVSTLPYWVVVAVAGAGAVASITNAVSGVLSDMIELRRLRQIHAQQTATHELTTRIARHVGMPDE